MVKRTSNGKWKYNNIEGKYTSAGSPAIHQDSGSIVGTIFPAGAEVVAAVVAKVSQDSEEVKEILEEL